MTTGFRWLLEVAAVMLLAGCAAVITKDSTPEVKREAVQEQAKARWELIIKGQADKAYGYFSKASRQVISRDDFVARMSKTAFRTAAVEKVECSEESCRAWVRITYDHPMMKGVGLTMQENWVLEDGKIWFVWSV
jgi:hypothetical protein